MRKLTFTLSSPLILLLILILVVAIIQRFVLATHLDYGFRDMDWVFIRDYKRLSPFSLENFFEVWQKWGVYTYQMYYIGIQEQFFKFDFRSYHNISHLMKLLSVISFFPLVLIITKNRAVAFLSTILYSMAYPAAGALFQVVQSANYLAVAVMNIFLWLLWYILEEKKYNLKWILAAFFLLMISFFLSPERMYPLLVVILFSMITWVFLSGSKNTWKVAAKILLIFFLPIIIAYFYKPQAFTLFFANTQAAIQYIKNGNWHLLLTPFISMGSIFIPNEQWRIFGTVEIESFKTYLEFLFGRPLILFGLFSFFLAALLSLNPLKFTLKTLIPTIFFSLISFILARQHLLIPESKRMHFDPAFLTPALIGLFIICLTVNLFLEWIKQKEKKRLLLSLFLGPAVAFAFIFLTWIVADPALVFNGPHRYLTIPASGSSLFIASLFVLIFISIHRLKRVGFLAYGVLILLIPLIFVQAMIIDKFFYDEVHSAGLDGITQTKMKGELWSNLTNFSDKEPSLFWFDESADYQNGYTHESAVLAGFEAWMMFRGDQLADPKVEPGMLRTNIVCPTPRRNCIDYLKQYLTTKDGIKGFNYGGKFYKLENFYAFSLINKRVINITNEAKGTLGI